MTIQLPMEQEAQLVKIASLSGQSASQLASQVLTSYLDHHHELEAEFTRAKADLAAGRVFTTEQVRERLQHRLVSK